MVKNCHGKKHDIYENPRTHELTQVLRHPDINEYTARERVYGMDLIDTDKTVSHRRTCIVDGNTFGLFGIFFLFEAKKGTKYGRDMSRDAIEYYLGQILHDYGEDGKTRALNSLRLRISWLNDKNHEGHTVGLTRIYDAWTNR
jgi:hypothetical protein